MPRRIKPILFFPDEFFSFVLFFDTEMLQKKCKFLKRRKLTHERVTRHRSFQAQGYVGEDSMPSTSNQSSHHVIVNENYALDNQNFSYDGPSSSDEDITTLMLEVYMLKLACH